MKKTLVPFLVALLAGAPVCPIPAVFAKSGSGVATLDGNASLDGKISVPNGGMKVSLSAADESIRTVLRKLSVQGGFNLMMDESVTGNVTVEMSNVTLNQALDSVASLGNLKILKQSGNIFLAISREAAQEKGLDRQLSKVIPINYTNASRVAQVLNSSIFANSTGTGSGSGSSGSSSSTTSSSGSTGNIQTARADNRTNSIILVGTAHDIELAEATIARMDIPRQSKTFYLSHANALDVATMLAGSVFNDGTGAFRVGMSSSSSSTTSSSGSSSGMNGMMSMSPTTVRVERQDVKEGSGISSFGSTGGNGTTSGLSSTVTLRGFVKTQDTASIYPDSALVIPDTRQNAITIMGTAEQIALAESLIPTFDAKLPQVSIEASLVEITDVNSKEFSTRLGIADGKLQFGFNNQPLTSISGNGLIGLSTISDPTDISALARSGVSFNSRPAITRPDYALAIRNLVTQNKARVLANPTVVATHDTESIISIVDEIVRRVVTTVDQSGFATQTIEIGEAGIVMDILPQIGEDGTVSMRIRPSVTSVLREEVVLGNLVTLLSKRDLLTQNVRLKDGETLVIGGLIQEQSTARTDKLPGVSDLPIVGAMFRASQNSGKRSELVLMITPHIINNLKLTPVRTTTMQTPTQTSLAGGN